MPLSCVLPQSILQEHAADSCQEAGTPRTNGGFMPPLYLQMPQQLVTVAPDDSSWGQTTIVSWQEEQDG